MNTTSVAWVLVLALAVSTGVLAVKAGREAPGPARPASPVQGVVAVGSAAPDPADGMEEAFAAAIIGQLRVNLAEEQKTVAALEAELEKERAARKAADAKAEMTPKAYDLFKETIRLKGMIEQLRRELDFQQRKATRGKR